MKSNFIFLFCLQTVLFSLFSCNLETFGEPYYEVRVDAVVSKDTVKIRFVDYVPDGLRQVESVRLIGVEIPSLKSPDNQYATDEPYAAEAADKIKSLCGKTFIIFFNKKHPNLRLKNISFYPHPHSIKLGLFLGILKSSSLVIFQLKT